MKQIKPEHVRKSGSYSASKLYIAVLIIALLLLLVLVPRFSSNVITKPEQKAIEIKVPEINLSIGVTVPLVPIEPSYPNPTNTPTLKPMGCYNNNDIIWHPCNPMEYITPNNEWVRYYASQLFVDFDGYIKYKHEKIISLIDTKGNILKYDYKPFENNYFYDWEQFGTGSKGSLANDDYWAQPDYYLTNGLNGDCDEWANTVTSMMLSGEMSVWQSDKLTKQIISAKAKLGYIGGITDVWVEYLAYNISWITSTSRNKDGYGNDFSTTIFIKKDNQFNPIFEYNDKYFKRV